MTRVSAAGAASDAVVSAAGVLELEPQAHRATAIARTRSSAVIFFIFLISSLKFLM